MTCCEKKALTVVIKKTNNHLYLSPKMIENIYKKGPGQLRHMTFEIQVLAWMMEQTQWGAKPINRIPPSPRDKWITSGNTNDKNKRISFH